MTDADRSKLVVALLVIGLASVLLWVARITGDQWSAVVTWTVAAYMVGQVGAVLAQGWTVQAVQKQK